METQSQLSNLLAVRQRRQPPLTQLPAPILLLSRGGDAGRTRLYSTYPLKKVSAKVVGSLHIGWNRLELGNWAVV